SWPVASAPARRMRRRPRGGGSGAYRGRPRPLRRKRAWLIVARERAALSGRPPIRGEVDAVGPGAEWLDRGRHVGEAREGALEGNRHRARGAVAVLGDDEVGFARPRRLLLVGRLAVQQDHHVGVLLERARFTQVRERGLLVDALLGAAVELRERDHRNLQFLREQLERPRELRHLLLAALHAPTRGHALQVAAADER